MSSSVLVIGIGNEYRSDDSAGLMVIRALKAENLLDVTCLEHNGDGTILMETWNGASKVILIDAISSGALPGTIYRFDALKQAFPVNSYLHSTHAFGVAEAIHLAQTLDQLPTELIVYGIEGKNFIAGVVLSPEVIKAAREVVAQIVQEIQEATGRR